MANPADTKNDQHKKPIILFEFDVYTITSANDLIRIIEDPDGTADNITADVPDGTYDGDSLSTAIASALITASAATGNTLTYACEFDPVNHYFTIRQDDVVIRIDVSEGDMSATIGFTVDQDSDDSNPDNSITSDSPALPGANSIYIATQAIVAGTGNDFDTNGTDINYTDEFNRAVDLGTITSSVNEIGGFANSGNVVLTLSNQELRSDILATVDFINRPCAIFVIFDDNTDLVWSEKVNIYSGVFNTTSLNEQGFYLPLNDGKKRFNKVIPLTFIDAATYTNADPASIGRPIQTVFGDFEPSDYLFSSAVQLYGGGSANLSLVKIFRPNLPAFPSCGFVDKSSGKFLVSNHVLDSFGTNAPLYFLKDYNAYMFLSNETRNNTAPTDISWGAVRIDGKVELRPTDRHNNDPGDITDYSNAIDDSTTTSVTIGTSEGLILKISKGTAPGIFDAVDASDCGVVFKFGLIADGGVGTADVVWYDEAGAKNIITTIDSNQSGDDYTAYDIAAAVDQPDSWEQFVQYGFGIETDANTTVAIIDIFIYMIDITMSMSKQIQEKDTIIRPIPLPNEEVIV